MKLSFINPKHLVRAKYNPANRTTPKYIKALKNSIGEHGILCPILVDNKLNVIDGHRRIACARALKLAQVPVVITECKLPSKDYFENINSTQRKISNNDMIYIYVNGGKVPEKALTAITQMEHLLGKSELRKISNKNTSFYVLKQATNIAKYCKKDGNEFVTNAMKWLINNKQSYVARKAMEDGVGPITLSNAITKNRALKRDWK